MKSAAQLEYRASSSRSKHEGESSFGLCDRLCRTRDNSQRQLPTDQDYAVPTREYQTDQSSLKSAPTAARSVLEKRRKQRQQQKKPLDSQRLTRSLHIRAMRSLTYSGRSVSSASCPIRARGTDRLNLCISSYRCTRRRGSPEPLTFQDLREVRLMTPDEVSSGRTYPKTPRKNLRLHDLVQRCSCAWVLRNL